MRIKKILLSNFRNISNLDLNVSDGINIFLGNNAQGKTNILESIYFSSVLRYRAAKVTDLITWDNVAAFVKIFFDKAGVSQDVGVEMSAETKGRRLFVNGEPVRVKGFIGRLNSVLFSPEDLFIFKGAPAERRKFLDAEISQASPVYYENLSLYNKIIAQRNNLLKKIREGFARRDNLDTWNLQLAKYAAQITRERLIAVDTLNDFAKVVCENISAQNENFSVTYDFKEKDFDVSRENFYSEDFTKKLCAWYEKKIFEISVRDIERGVTTWGPHLDDLKFFINGRELKLYGSQGQLRTAALSLKLSELEFLKHATGEYPVLLLDDVMSELDAERREQLLIFLKRKEIQTLITATEKKYFPARNFGKIFEVCAGTVKVMD